MSRDMQQKLALLQFKLSFSIDTSPQLCEEEYDYNDNLSWHPKTMNWSMDSDYCKWDGVTCNHTTGDVIGLDLYCRRLVGSINPNSTLFQLSHLQVINFNGNYISGVIPEEIFHLPNLEELSISPGRRAHSNNLKQVSASLNFPKVRWGSNNTLQKLDLTVTTIIGGVLPEEIFYLPSLIELSLDSINLSSISVPKLKWDTNTTLHTLSLGVTFVGGIPEEIFHLPNLKELRINPAASNNVSVSLPKLKWGSSTTLQTLDLSGITISGGVIPDSIGYLNSLTTLYLWDCNLSGPIPKSISNLTQLTDLDLDTNHLSGQIPDSLANLKKLTLSYNNLKGEFPSWVANLTQLQYLYLDGNSLTGSLPSYLPLHSLPQLYHLDLSDNSLNGTLPSWLFQLPSLIQLEIDSNKFTGQLPYQFKSLLSFSCSNNLLNGTIPISFSDQLVSLIVIDLSSNKFSGDLDLHNFSHLDYLQTLHLSHNSLSLTITSTTTLPPGLERLGLASCKITKFPHFIRSLKNLTYLDLSNNQIDENIPNWIASLENLEYLDLSNNQIDGNIPNWIGGLIGRSSLTYLNLSYNSLTGGLEQLPWSSLQYLNLQSNMLNGSLTTSICNMSSLEVLNLSHNNLSGLLPVCPGNLNYSLSVLDLRKNNISGSLPLAFSNFQNLRSVYMHGNKLQGTIPPSFCEFDFLEVLDLGSNNINDTFPHCLEALPSLQVLILKSNKFHGIINKFSKVERPFFNLRIMDVSDNEFSGPLPTNYIKNFKAMMDGEVDKVQRSYMGDFYYSDSVILVIKGIEMEFVKILTVLTTIDLSSNKFNGEIPEYIGNLVSLRGLNLSHNHLMGSIPSLIGNLPVLESLDLSSNLLVGRIPQQLTHIYSLEQLNLSHNDLNGHIPEGAQFNTFENNSYAGNMGLCGHPLSIKCGRDISEHHEEEDDEDGNNYFFSDFSWEAVVIGYGSGVVVGFVGGYIMFMAGKPKWYVGIIAIELGLKVRRMEIMRR